ncbi:hypothetical protein DAEQUDRAFT_711084 [Daedalea quercina L-15889]|uniref:Nuclear fusion protein KAR5 n=1 Tax=Daedalea quercina L-15889 TaxID=1314783 RepID=A0A165Q1F6_9APHY|nr:hypothetical protein DAEQUDRAFT_711084 [Daedalea quercina L-15889]
MYPPLLLLVYTLLPAYTHAISWPKGNARVSQETVNAALGAHSDEIAHIIRGTESLQAYNRKPDCFRRATGLIQTRCSELDMDEDERISAAISMTLCELSTANHHSPLECVAFSAESRISQTIVKEGSHRSCVEALSRSAQYWSSYSGYLREVSQLCYAFRRWNDIDTARDIYRNATLENLAFLQHMSAREITLHKAEETSHAILQDILEGVAELRISSTDAQSVLQQLIQGVSVGLGQSTQAMTDAITSLLARAGHDQTEAVSRVNSAIDGVIQRHSTSLNLVATSLEQSLQDEIKGVLLHLGQQFSDIRDIAVRNNQGHAQTHEVHDIRRTRLTRICL